VVAAGIGILVAYRFYISNPETPKKLAVRFPGVYETLLNKYYVDEFYNAAIVQPLITVSRFFYQVTDLRGVDGLANGMAKVVGWASTKFRIVHSGLLRNYALIFAVGVVILLGYVILR
jgi:NADH-quinone oxidoreductase subunit L